MSLTITVPQNYGYSVLIALGVIPFVAFAHGSMVTSLRRRAEVPYPHAYASIEQAKANKFAYKFNCAQRAHGNLLENMNQTVASILFAGLFYPTAAAATGAAWVLFRSLYAYGYITSTINGKERALGYPQWLFQAGLWGLCISGALKLI